MNDEHKGNYGFIDGQNLYMGTAKRTVDPWKINLARFRVYLKGLGAPHLLPSTIPTQGGK